MLRTDIIDSLLELSAERQRDVAQSWAARQQNLVKLASRSRESDDPDKRVFAVIYEKQAEELGEILKEINAAHNKT